MRRPKLVFGLAVFAVVAVAAVAAPLLLSTAPDALNVSARLQAPSAEAWFGTDEFGRDVFARVIYGGRLSLGIGAATAILSSLFGVALGLLAGFPRRSTGCCRASTTR